MSAATVRAPVSSGAEQSAQTVGPWRIIREIGRGGMGVVYLAMRDDGAFRKNVALKLLLREQVSPEFVARFKQERQVVAALDHPNIARILDGGDAPDGMPYYVMEYVEGLQIDKFCDDQRLSLTGRVRLFQQVCQAVHYLHQNSIVHRDLKPSNILVSSDGVVKLLDFGIAKLVGAASFTNQELTTADARPMTPVYASPEQIAGAATLQNTSDIYSLGAVLYKLVTGRTPWESLEEKMLKLARREDPPLPSANIREDLRVTETAAQLRRAMLGGLDSIVLMAMRYEPKQRYQSAAALAEDLRRFIDGQSVMAHRDSMASWSMKALKRKRVAAGVAAAFLAVSSWGAFEWRRAQTEQADAAARESRYRDLLDGLESRLKKDAPNSRDGNSSADSSSARSVAEQIRDVRRLKNALDTERVAAVQGRAGSTVERHALLDRGIRYLDNLRYSPRRNPVLGMEVASTYLQLGAFQESLDKQTPATRLAVLKTYGKAATVLTEISAAHPDDAGARDRLEAVNRRIGNLGGTAPQPAAEPPVVLAQAQPAGPKPAAPAAQRSVDRREEAAGPQPVAAAPTPQADPAPKPPPAIAPELEDRLINVTAKVQTAEQSIEPYRRSLERDGQTLNADTASALSQMRANLNRARREIAEDNEVAAQQSLSRAEALANKVLRTVNR